jgi:hypothetical protein
MKEKEEAAVTTTTPTVHDAKVQNFYESAKYLEEKIHKILVGNEKLRSALEDAELKRISEDIADEYSAQKTKDVTDALNAEYEGVSGAALLAREITTPPTLYSPILPLVGVGVLAGESDANKSMFLRQLAICTATGRDFLGFRYNGTKKYVLFVSTEDDANSTAFFLQRNHLQFPDSGEEWQNMRFFFDSEMNAERLGNIIEKHPADLVIIDSLPDVFDGKDTNNMAQMRDFLRPYTKLASEHQCLVLFLHHVGKGKENLAPSKNLLNGSQSLEGAARVVMLLLKDKSADNLRHLCIVKHNYLAPEYKRESIVLNVDPHTFTFTPTGLHIPFDELVDRSGATNRKPISDYGTEDDFIKFFQKAAAGVISKTALMKEVKDGFHANQKNAYDIINYAVYKNWIAKKESEGKREYYEFSAAF